MDLTKAFLVAITSQEEPDFAITAEAIAAGTAAPIDSFDTEDEANAAKDAWLGKPHPAAYRAAVIKNPNVAPVTGEGGVAITPGGAQA